MSTYSGSLLLRVGILGGTFRQRLVVDPSSRRHSEAAENALRVWAVTLDRPYLEMANLIRAWSNPDLKYP